jgi:hypothetical protein
LSEFTNPRCPKSSSRGWIEMFSSKRVDLKPIGVLGIKGIPNSNTPNILVVA